MKESIETKETVIEEGFSQLIKDNEVYTLNENKEVVLNEDIRLGGLKKIITRYVQGSQNHYENDNWSIKSLNEDRDTWTLSYNGRDIIECNENYAYFTDNVLSYEDACKVAGVVEAFYGHEVDLSKYTNVE